MFPRLTVFVFTVFSSMNAILAAESGIISVIQFRQILNAHPKVIAELKNIQNIEREHTIEYNNRLEKIRKIAADLRELTKQIEAPNISDDEKNVLIKKRRLLANEGNLLENNRRQWVIRSSNRRYQDRHMKLFKLSRQIAAETSETCEKMGLLHVLDSSLRSSSGSLLVLYHSSTIDCTTQVKAALTDGEHFPKIEKVVPIKIAVVDMKKFLKSYPHTRTATALKKARLLKYEIDNTAKLEEIRRIADKLKQSRSAQTNREQPMEMSEAEKKRRSSYDSTYDTPDYRKKAERFRKQVLAEDKRIEMDKLTTIVQKFAIKHGYDLVLDSSAESSYYSQVVVSSKGVIDLTDKILQQLNVIEGQ